VTPGRHPQIETDSATSTGGTSLALVLVVPAQCHGLVVTVVVLASLAGGPSVLAQDAGSGLLTGEVTAHVVARRETLASLSARFGIDTPTLAVDNGLRVDDPLPVGRVLRIDNRHIAPSGQPATTLVVNLPQRMLFFKGDAVVGLPVAVGRPDWPTPIGDFTVATREENPTWDVPASILAEARRAGRAQPARVPPGPDNPLGAFWLGLSSGGIGIHGTIVPGSIYRFASHGCIRLHPDDIAWLFPRVAVGTTVAIIYEPVLLARAGDRVFVEIHADRYGHQVPTLTRVRELAAEHGVTELIDWPAAARAVRARHGVARDITRVSSPES
jgi:L,D-transpeptidase ErfK/SrfK